MRVKSVTNTKKNSFKYVEVDVFVAKGGNDRVRTDAGMCQKLFQYEVLTYFVNKQRSQRLVKVKSD